MVNDQDQRLSTLFLVHDDDAILEDPNIHVGVLKAEAARKVYGLYSRVALYIGYASESTPSQTTTKIAGQARTGRLHILLGYPNNFLIPCFRRI